jgi:hypothetical protein
MSYKSKNGKTVRARRTGEKIRPDHEDFENWLLELGGRNLELLSVRGFNFSDEHVFDVVERMLDAPAVAVISAPRTMDDEQLITWALIKWPANWEPGGVIPGDAKIAVIPCRDTDQVRRVAIKHGGAGMML